MHYTKQLTAKKLLPKEIAVDGVYIAIQFWISVLIVKIMKISLPFYTAPVSYATTYTDSLIQYLSSTLFCSSPSFLLFCWTWLRIDNCWQFRVQRDLVCLGLIIQFDRTLSGLLRPALGRRLLPRETELCIYGSVCKAMLSDRHYHHQQDHLHILGWMVYIWFHLWPAHEAISPKPWAILLIHLCIRIALSRQFDRTLSGLLRPAGRHLLTERNWALQLWFRV